MKKNTFVFQNLVISILFMFVIVLGFDSWSFALNSELFPYVSQSNSFVFQEKNGFRLSDFSYAGYAGGERSIPNKTATKTLEPIAGDNTSSIQGALNHAQGGCLQLKPGIYEIRDEIIIPSNTVLKGSGTDQTYIKIVAKEAARKSFLVGHRSIKTSPAVNYWSANSGTVYEIVKNIEKNSLVVSLSSVVGLAPGNWVIIRNTVDDDLRKLYNDGKSTENNAKLWPSDLSSIKYLRKIVGIVGNDVKLNQPIYLPLSITHDLKLIKVTYMAEEIGLEDLSIGFEIDLATQSQYNSTKSNGSTASSHACNAIFFGNVVNGWIRNVKTYSPLKNGFHIYSRGINLTSCKWVTVENCDFGYPVNIGNGGNGYLYVLSTADSCLIKKCSARYGRHNFLFHFPSSGNVITGCSSYYSYFFCDYHHSLANSNLIENSNFVSNSYYPALACYYRGSGSNGAGYTGANNVFWNIRITGEQHTMKGAETFAVKSDQTAGNDCKGYIIGASHVVGSSETVGNEWREAIGSESELIPQSLFDAQRDIRFSEGKLNPPKKLRVK